MNQESSKSLRQPHQLSLEERKSLFVSGVQDVDSFDEYRVVVFTNLGKLTVIGKNLHVNTLNVENGELSLEGDIDAVDYSEETDRKTGFFASLFR